VKPTPNPFEALPAAWKERLDQHQPAHPFGFRLNGRQRAAVRLYQQNDPTWWAKMIAEGRAEKHLQVCEELWSQVNEDLWMKGLPSAEARQEAWEASYLIPPKRRAQDDPESEDDSLVSDEIPSEPAAGEVTAGPSPLVQAELDRNGMSPEEALSVSPSPRTFTDGLPTIDSMIPTSG
jgi:hypothetical protein